MVQIAQSVSYFEVLDMKFMDSWFWLLCVLNSCRYSECWVFFVLDQSNKVVNLNCKLLYDSKLGNNYLAIQLILLHVWILVRFTCIVIPFIFLIHCISFNLISNWFVLPTRDSSFCFTFPKIETGSFFVTINQDRF